MRPNMSLDTFIVFPFEFAAFKSFFSLRVHIAHFDLAILWAHDKN